jgi:benzoyl-CoA reductase/2-hydroxyglutaryl-CoA dehydratase subunit BcrC/BadD/HgdB
MKQILSDSPHKKPKTKKIPSVPLLMLNNLLINYYKKLDSAVKKKQKIVWASLGVPKNILYALDVIPVYPQFHTAFQSAKGLAGKIIGTAEGDYEIPQDLCGDIKAMICTVIKGDSLSFKLPDPDMMVSTNCACFAQTKGFYFLHHQMKVPLFFYDYPRILHDTINPYDLNYINKQLDEFVDVIEKRFKTRFDRERYNRSTLNDYKIYTVWQEIMKLCRTRPSPVSALDLHFMMIPFFCMDSNSDNNLGIYTAMYNAMFEICEKNKESKKTEKKEIRLLWDFLPINHKGRFFKKLFAMHNACVVMSTHFPELNEEKCSELRFQYPVTRKYVDNYVKGQSFDTMNLRMNYMSGFMNRSINSWKKLIRKMIKGFEIDGVVMHIDTSCRMISLPQYELAHYVREELKTPIMTFHSNAVDERYFSESQIVTRVEAFMEQLGEQGNS